MADVTVTQLAKGLNVPVDRLLKQLEEAGITVSGADDLINDDAKMELLTFLRRSHGSDASVAAPRKITLKRKSQGEIKVATAQGRARTVNVEVRTKKTYLNRSVLEDKAQVQQEAHQHQPEPEPETIVEEPMVELKPVVELTSEELEAARLAAEKLQREHLEAEMRRMVSAEAHQRAEEESRRIVGEREQAELLRTQQEQTERSAREAKAAKTTKERAKPAGRTELHMSSDASARFKKKKQQQQQQLQHNRSRKPMQVAGSAQHGFEKPVAPVKHDVQIPETITVSELAQSMAVKATEVIKVMMNMGVMATINQPIDQDTAVLVVEELGHNAVLKKESAMDDELHSGEGQHELLSRPPVVTVMGHVDHGKTSLLDHIRRSKVATGEAGGITQHIGAYHVETPKGVITFLDTPGHAAFSAMRARGAQVTDVVILVVAADDGVMPQTVEAIKHAREAKVPLIVAVTKVDKPEADPDRIRNELVKHDVIPEEWGGDTMFVNVSARAGTGIDELLDAILLQAEVLELKAATEGMAAGVVIESWIEKGRGAVATILVKRGTLKAGDPIIAGQEFGRVRALFDESGKQVTSAGPSLPIVVLGLSGSPHAGDDLLVLESERKVREVALYRQGKFRDTKLAKAASASKLEDIFSQTGEGKSAVVAVIIKADVQGSAEALRDALTQVSTDEVTVKVLSSSVGGITGSDASLAAASNALIIGFNVRADGVARTAIKDGNVDVRYYSIIYEAIDYVKQLASGLLAPEIKETIVGLAEVRDVFRSSKLGTVAGCIVSEGYVKRNFPIRVLRNNVVIFEGGLESLRRFKDDVNEVRSGTECGIGVKGYNDVQVGDQIECYTRTEVARTVE
ncbi:MAG: translation initiation factor IF-2 [Steroidobacteraceae bacterium]